MRTSDGFLALCLAPVIILFSMLYIVNELQQLINLGVSKYFNTLWNYVDLCG